MPNPWDGSACPPVPAAMAVPVEMMVEWRAVPLASPVARTGTSGPFVIVLCAVALAVSALLVAAQPVAAVELGDRIAAVRAAQRSAEASMRAQDQAVASLDAQLKAAKKQLKPLERVVGQRKAQLAGAKAMLATRRARLSEKESLYADPSAAPSDFKSRLAGIRADIRAAERSRDAAIARQKAAVRAVWGKKTQIRNTKSQRQAAIARREAAEGSLSAYIKQMTELAGIKVAEQATVSLAEGGTFSWPTTGRISQTYGCTGVVYNPRRGSCKHFHDGIDVVDAYGTPVRAIAAGVVAYAGWNPYDQEGRAYVVDVVHADGYVSRYGHLIAGSQVKAGDLVYTGQVLGRMGSTGKSTGTHLHFEVLRNGKDVNPLDLLPAGVIKVDKSSTKAGLAQLARASRQESRPKRPKKTPLPPPDKPFAFAEETPVATCATDDAGSKDKNARSAQQRAVECEPTGLFAAAAADGPPGLPLPYRGTSPAA